MFIDIHVHPAFYEPINRDLAREEMRHEALDIHKNGTAPLAHIFNQMRCAGLDRLCLLAQDYSTSIGQTVVSNQEIRELLDLAPDRFFGFASVDPHDPKAVEKLEDAFLRLGLQGLNLQPGRQKFLPSAPELEPIYAICERFDKPVLFHAGLSWEPDTQTRLGHPLEFEAVAAAHPKLRICLGHFGWPWVRETAMLMLKYPNVYADTACCYMDCPEQFFEQLFLKQMGPLWVEHNLADKLLFGSNNPRFRPARIKRGLESLHFSAETTAKILGLNAEKFLGMEGNING